MRKTFWLLVTLPITVFYAIKIIHSVVQYIWPGITIEAKYGFVFLVVVLIGVYLNNIYLTFKHSRNSKYGEALNTITSGFANIHDLNRYTNEQLVSKIIEQGLKDLCTNISFALTVIAGYKVSCCIKIMVPSENGNFALRTLCRDTHDGAIRFKPDYKKEHFLNDNTDFKTLLNDLQSGKARYFMSNKLNWLKDYHNSSFGPYGGRPEWTGNFIYDFFLTIKRTFWWPLPYKSTIIVPIIPVNYNPNDEILGFLCVDSPNMFVFKRYYDVDLLVGLADGMYNSINKLHSLTKN